MLQFFIEGLQNIKMIQLTPSSWSLLLVSVKLGSCILSRWFSSITMSECSNSIKGHKPKAPGPPIHKINSRVLKKSRRSFQCDNFWIRSFSCSVHSIRDRTKNFKSSERHQKILKGGRTRPAGRISRMNLYARFESVLSWVLFVKNSYQLSSWYLKEKSEIKTSTKSNK